MPPEERKCTLCTEDKIDDEIHVITECTASANDRTALIEKLPIQVAKIT